MSLTRFLISPTPSNTASNTPEVSPSGTACPTPTSTTTPTNTPTNTQTASVSATMTATPNITPTSTTTQTITPTNTGTPTQTPSVSATNTATPSITPTSTNTPTNTQTPSPTPVACCDELIFSGKNATFSAFTGTYYKQPMNGSYYGYLDDSPGFTVKCQIFNGLYWSVWKSINNDVIIFSEQSATWRVIDNESSLVSCNSFLSAFTYQNITNQYVIDCNGLQVPVDTNNSNYSLSYSNCGVPIPTQTNTPTPTQTTTITSTPTETPSITLTLTSTPTTTQTQTPSPTPSITPYPVCPEELSLSGITNPIYNGIYNRIYSYTGGSFTIGYFNAPISIPTGTFTVGTMPTTSNGYAVYQRVSGADYYTIIMRDTPFNAPGSKYSWGVIKTSGSSLVNGGVSVSSTFIRNQQEEGINVGSIYYPQSGIEAPSGGTIFNIVYPVVCPTPTSTTTPTTTPTNTQTASVSPTNTGTPDITTTPTSTSTPTITSTPTNTPTVSGECRSYRIENNTESSISISYYDCSGVLQSDPNLGSGDQIAFCSNVSYGAINYSSGTLFDQGLCV